jgi:FlaA1/EpsC-like NDP-sugar epimerase
MGSLHEGEVAGPNSRFAALAISLLLRLLAMERWHKRLLVYSIDGTACVIATFLAFSLRVGALSFPLLPPLIFLAVALPLFTATFSWRKVYSNIFRYSGGRAILQIGVAVAVYMVPLVAVFMIGNISGVPRTIAILQPLIFFCLVATIRITARYLLTDLVAAHGHSGSVRRVLIYGAGVAGQQLALSSRHDPGLSVIGFLDDDARLSGQKLDGIPIYASSKFASLYETREIDAVLLAIPNARRSRRAEIVKSLEPYRIQVLTLPPLHQLVKGEVSVNDLREVQIEDLLGREPVQPNELLLAKSITGKVVMVTGAGGSIGSELCRQIVTQRPLRLVLVEVTEHALYQIDTELRERLSGMAVDIEIVPELLSVVDRDAVFRTFESQRPHTVFHAAAYKHVPLVELNPLSAIQNNILGTRNAAEAARQFGAERFILISTDKAVRPTSVMGATKRVCEQVLQVMALEGGGTRFAMVRFGNVLGSSGSVVPRFLRQIRAGGPVTLTHREITRYFMTIPEAAQLVIQAGAMAEGGEVYLLDMGEPVRIYDLARTMISLSGLTVKDDEHPRGDVEIVEVGLRSGEKLYEELLIGEDAKLTTHARIRYALEHAPESKRLHASLDAIFEGCRRGDREMALANLRELVPEFAAPEIDSDQARPSRTGSAPVACVRTMR